jgi:hypothetical protein
MASYDPGGYNDDLDNSPARARDLYWRRWNRHKWTWKDYVYALLMLTAIMASGYLVHLCRGGSSSGAAAISLPAGTRVADSDTELMKGGAIFVEWRGSWYRAEVVKEHDDGTVRIHYVGWDDKWDEDVQRDRVRVGP